MHWGIAGGLSALCYAFWALFLRAGTIHYGWRDVLFWAVVTEAVVVVSVTGPGMKLSPIAAGWGVAAGLCAAVGYMLFVSVLGRANSSLPVVVMSMYPIVVIVLARLILHEAISWEKWLGVGLAMVAVWLVVK